MPALILSIPLFLIVVVLFCLSLWVNDSYAPYLVIPFVSLAVIYVFSPEINWWWFKRHPPDVPDQLKPFFRYSAYYQRLPEKLQLRFRQKVAMFMLGVDFKTPDEEGKVPGDIQAALAASVVPLILGTETLQFEPFEHVVVYATPFPSPQYPTRLHLSEIYEEDGVSLFSAEHLLKGFVQPEQYFPIGLYEYARIFLRLREKQNLPSPMPEATDWPSIEQIAGYSRARIAQWINLEETEIVLPAVAITHFFLFPERFRAVLPELYAAYCRLFEHDPLDFGGLERRLEVVSEYRK